jgi:hypothetical protein
MCLHVCDQQTPKREAKCPFWIINAVNDDLQNMFYIQHSQLHHTDSTSENCLLFIILSGRTYVTLNFPVPFLNIFLNIFSCSIYKIYFIYTQLLHTNSATS